MDVHEKNSQLLARVQQLEIESNRLETENNELRQLFHDALDHGFETWIMDRARKLSVDRAYDHLKG